MKLILEACASIFDDRLVVPNSELAHENKVKLLEKSLQLEHKKQVPIDMFLYFQPA
jgi:hypothetical protein